MKLRRIIYFILLILSLVLISFYGGTVSYAFFFMMLLIPVLSYAYLLSVYFQFLIYQKLESRDVISNIPKGYYFILKNEGIIAFSSIQIKMFSSFSEIEELPEETEFCLLPGEQYKFETRLCCKYRGEYEVGIKEIILTDFLKLFQFKYKVMGTIKAIVAPCLVELSQVESLDKAVSMAARESIYQKNQLDTIVREYESGDPLRNVNWKLSAKEGRLMSRQLCGEEKQGLVIMAESKRYSEKETEYLPLEDQILELTLALSLYLVKKDVPVDFVNENYKDKITMSGLGDFNLLYESMKNFQFRHDYEMEKIAESNFLLLSSYQVVVMVVHSMSEKMLAIVRELSEAGTYVIVYLIDSGEMPDSIRGYARQESFRGSIVPVSIDDDLANTLR